jgi:DNA repair exonuclease SbcCD ATPase subunit
MRKISISGIYLNNFRSFVETDFVHVNRPGLCALVGENKIEPRLGSNGAGKSSLWDALVWCFYNKSIRGLKASDLTCSFSDNNISVGVDLIVDGVEYEITRYGSPNKLLVNNEIWTQEQLEELLGLSYDQFLNSVLFGQLVPWFVDLTPTARATVLQQVLDVELWEKAVETTKKIETSLEQEKQSAQQIINIADNTLKNMPDLEELLDQERAYEDILECRRIEALAAYDFVEAEVAQYKEELSKLHHSSSLLSNGEAATENRKFQEKHVRELAAKVNTQEYQVKLLESDMVAAHNAPTTCSMCGQPIPVTDAKERAEHISKELTEIKTLLKNTLYILQQAEKDLDTFVELEKEAHDTYIRLNSVYLSKQERLLDREKQLKQCLQVLEAAAADKNPFTRIVKEHEQTQKRVIADKMNGLTAHKRLSTELADTAFWSKEFKSIKIYHLGSIFSALSHTVNGMLESLGLTGWQIKFVTETTTKSGATKIGVQIEVSSHDYNGRLEAWSGGEGQRIRLAVALGLATIIQYVAGVEYDIEIWDEPSAWLDTYFGVPDLLATLSERARQLNKAVRIVDHRTLDTAFDYVYKVTKEAEGSKVEEVQ